MSSSEALATRQSFCRPKGAATLAKLGRPAQNTEVTTAALKKTAPRKSVRTLVGNFGVTDEKAPHFRVNVPRSRKEGVEIVDVLPDEYGRMVEEARVILSRDKWDAVAERLSQFLNRRLKQEGLAQGSFRSGLTQVRRDLGKEITLLCWAIEAAEPGSFGTALSNWEGFEPEERWWLYTQTAATTGDAVAGRGRGWRKAIMYALTENPLAPEGRQSRRTPGFFQEAAAPRGPSLFDTTDE